VTGYHYIKKNVTEYLNEQFPSWGIGHGGLQNWPPWSPDLTSLDFHVWGYVKNMVHERKVNSPQIIYFCIIIIFIVTSRAMNVLSPYQIIKKEPVTFFSKSLFGYTSTARLAEDKLWDSSFLSSLWFQISSMSVLLSDWEIKFCIYTKQRIEICMLILLWFLSPGTGKWLPAVTATSVHKASSTAQR
jgi:hypothetical protein